MQRNHEEMTGKESEKAAHGDEVSHAHPGETADYCRERLKLHRFVEDEAGDSGRCPAKDGCGVSEFLQRIVFPRKWRHGAEPAEPKAVPHHRPHSSRVGRHEDSLAPMSGQKLVRHINDPATGEEPCKGKMPLQRTTEPSS